MTWNLAPTPTSGLGAGQVSGPEAGHKGCRGPVYPRAYNDFIFLKETLKYLRFIDQPFVI